MTPPLPVPERRRTALRRPPARGGACSGRGGRASRAASLALTGVVAAGVLLGCSGTSSPPAADRGAPAVTSPSGPQPAVGAAATTTRSAELRAALAHTLTERAHLVDALARALADARGRREDAGVRAAEDALQGATAALAGALASAYPRGGEGFEVLLRTADGHWADRAAAAVRGDRPAVAAATEALTADREAVVRALRRVVPEVGQAAVRGQLAATDAQLHAAVDARAAGDPEAVARVREAAAHAPQTAALLARGVVDRALGPVGTPAADLRARLTGHLTEQVLLLGHLAGELRREEDGRASEAAVAAARAALADGARQTSGVLGEAYPELAPQLRRGLAQRVDATDAYAVARLAGDVAAAGRASEALVAADAAVASALGGHVPRLPVRRTLRELEPARVQLQVAVDAAVDGESRALPALRRAGDRSPAVAALIAAAVAEDLGLR